MIKKHVQRQNGFTAEQWTALGIAEDQLKELPKVNYGEWQYVYDANNNLVRADQIMKTHNFTPDKMILANDSASVTPNINQINGLLLDNQFLGWGEMSLAQQNCLVNNICSIMSHYMTEKWIKFHSTDESKRDKIIEFEQSVKEFKVKELCATACYKTTLLGTTYFSPKLKGDEKDLQEPLLPRVKINKGDLEAIYIIEPTWTVPVQFNMTRPRSPNFYKPEKFIVYGEALHFTRMRQLMFIEPVNILSPMYLFGGIPPIQPILPYILDFINTKKEIVQIVSRYNLNILGTNLNALGGVGSVDIQKTRGRLKAFTALRNNWGVMLIDKETEQFTQMQINAAGLTDILQQQGELLSLFTRIPVTYLFGQSPKGLNATGQLDMQVFNELILSMQEAKLRPILDYLFEIMMMNLWGEIDEDITYTFVPLGSIDEVTQQDINSSKINDLATLVNSGMADPQQLMKIATQDESLGLSSYDTTQQPESEDDLD